MDSHFSFAHLGATLDLSRKPALDGRNYREIVIAESLVRVNLKSHSLEVISPSKAQKLVLIMTWTLRSLCRDSDRAIGFHSCNRAR